MKLNQMRRLCSLLCVLVLLVLIFAPMTVHAKGSISFTITDNFNAAVSGVVLNLFAKGNSQPVGEATSAANGQVIFADLEVGEYTITYKSFPAGYTQGIDASADFTVTDKYAIVYDRAPWEVLKPNRDNQAKTYPLYDVHGNSLPAGAVFNVTGTVIQNFTTDSAGLTLALPAGTYTLTNVKAPDGYVTNGSSVSLTVSNDGSFSFSKNPTDAFRFQLDSFSFSFTKVDDGGSPVVGATFQLTGPGINQSVTSNDAGVVTFSNLVEGNEYLLTETSAPSGYTRSKASIKVTVDDTGKATFDTDPAKAFINTRSLYTLTFYKRNDAGQALYGAVFTLTGEDDKATTLTAKSQLHTGQVLFRNIPHGVYALTETTAPDGYSSISSKVIIQVSPNGAVSYTEDPTSVFTSARNRFSFTFTAKDESGNRIQGAKYKLTGTAGHTAQSVANGKVTFDELLPGSYTLSQTSVPSGLTRSTQTVTITVDKEGKVTYSDPIESVIIAKATRYTVAFDKMDEMGNPVEGAAFRLSGEEYQKDAISEDDGRVRFTGLLPGTFTLSEVSAPAGYVKTNTTIEVTVSSDGVVTYSKEPRSTFANTRLMYNLEFITINDQDQPAKDAVFVLKGTNSYTEATSTRTGRVLYKDLAHGTYTLEQKSAPEGYTKSPAQVSVTISPTGVMTYSPIEGVEQPYLSSLDRVFINRTGPTSFSFESVDDAFKPLGGTQFLLRNTSSGETVTASSLSGIVTLYSLEPGKYTLLQSAAPANYTSDDKAYGITIEKGGNITVYAPDAEEGSAPLYQDKLIDGETHFIPVISFQSNRDRHVIQLYATDAQTKHPLSGLILSVAQEPGGDEIDLLMTGPEGAAASTQLLPGTYYLAAKSVPPNYELHLENGQIKLDIPANGLSQPVSVEAHPLTQEVTAPPATGFAGLMGSLSSNIPGIICIGLAILLMAGLVVLIFR